MSEQENTAIAQQGYDNFKTGNIEALLDQLSDDITWQLPEMKGVPLGGTRARSRSIQRSVCTLGGGEATAVGPRFP